MLHRRWLLINQRQPKDLTEANLLMTVLLSRGRVRLYQRIKVLRSRGRIQHNNHLAQPKVQTKRNILIQILNSCHHSRGRIHMSMMMIHYQNWKKKSMQNWIPLMIQITHLSINGPKIILKVKSLGNLQKMY